MSATDYILRPLETLPPVPTNPADMFPYLEMLRRAIDELNSKVEFVAHEAGVTIPSSGG